MGMGGDAAAHHVRSLDDGFQLVREELLFHTGGRVGQDATRCGDLDHIGAAADQGAHGFAALRRTVAGGFRGEHVQHVEREPVDVGMPTRRRHGAAGDAQARTGHIAIIDRVAQGQAGFEIAADILHRGEAGHQSGAGIAGAVEGEIRGRMGEAGEAAARPEFRLQVDMAVDEARHHIIIGQIDDGRAVRGDNTGLDALDAFTAYQDGLVLQRVLSGHGQQPAGMDHGQRRLVGSVLCLRQTGSSDQRQGGNGRFEHDVSLPR